MPVGRLILVETSSEGNLGAALRVAANFGVPSIHLVRPVVDPECDEVRRWSCGALEHLELRVCPSLSEAAAGSRTVIATASGRGREQQPLVSPEQAAAAIAGRGLGDTALVFGNETSGLTRDQLDACDMALHVPTAPAFPVLNLTQTIAIVLAHLSMTLETPQQPPFEPAAFERVEDLMEHLRSSLLRIGYLDPVNPERILRKLRRLFGRTGLSENEVALLRGICRQIDWAVGARGETPDAEEGERIPGAPGE